MADPFLQFGLRVWNLGEDGIDVYLPSAHGTLIRRKVSAKSVCPEWHSNGTQLRRFFE